MQRNRSQKLKWADKNIWWTVQKHIMEVNGALLNRSSQRRKRLWWRRWAYSLGCTCQMDRNWQYHGLSRLRRWNSSGDLQSRPGKGSNNNTHKKRGSSLKTVQWQVGNYLLLSLFIQFCTEPETCWGARIIHNITGVVVRIIIFNE